MKSGQSYRAYVGSVVLVFLGLVAFAGGEAPVYDNLKWAGIMLATLVLGPVVFKLLGIRSALISVLAGVGLVVTMGSLGALSHRSAVLDAVDRSEVLRESLADYCAKHGRFPKSIDELAMNSTPGDRLFHPTVIRYVSDGSGYKISFYIWFLREMVATSAGSLRQSK